MKLGIIGLPLAGKSTLFEALARIPHDPLKKAENRINTVSVPDERIDVLSKMYKPRKTIYAQVEYVLPGIMAQKEGKTGDQNVWTQVRSCDALIHVVRNYSSSGMGQPNSESDTKELDEELIFSDLVVVEKRLERMEAEKNRGRGVDNEEMDLLVQCKALLESNTPIRQNNKLAEDPRLRGFTFLSSKPKMIIFNNDDDDENIPEVPQNQSDKILAIRCRLEHEIAQMTDDEALEFVNEFHVSDPATARVLRESYDLLGLISFFTVGDDEVRAWTIKQETQAVDAADVIHSDIKKGFIRAEVIAYSDLMEAGSYAEARKKGTVRLEGKTYIVQDGDIINFRFNV